MVRGVSLLLGIGLAVLWLVGLQANATPWLVWLDALAALCAFGIAAFLVPDRATPSTMGGAPVALAIGLFILWVIGLAVRAQPWLVWWTFGFGCAFLALGLYAGGAGTRARTLTPTRTHRYT